ncbi:TIGR01906 family membrane protein [Clostridium sp.]|uniref:TIGR01906 family membrane protein n=1 Tax=Clostridium sp. TaxID=1506 RepID=UPI0026DD0A31|nr:TIGR01906 family membrane protein [Clostridium sp.]MDO5039911.1 TIGR01906 family membrane protein [Clostridium sp.]
MKNFIKELLIAVYFFIISILSSVLIIFNSTFIYKMCINFFNIEIISGIQKDLLIEDYKKIISYVTNPFVKELKLDNFVMSSTGEFHFWEVKNIVFIIEVIFLILLIVGIILFLLNRNNKFKLPINSLNYLFFFTVIVVFFILIFIYFDFTFVFDKFHKILFNNDYWIFNPITDPIIKALPEEFFMVCGVICLFITLLVGIISKFIYINLKKKYYKNVS